MAVIQDPQGAFFMLWEPREHIGAELVNAAGALTWNELYVPDIDAAQAFYGAVFGWSFAPMEGMATAACPATRSGRASAPASALRPTRSGAYRPSPCCSPSW